LNRKAGNGSSFLEPDGLATLPPLLQRGNVRDRLGDRTGRRMGTRLSRRDPHYARILSTNAISPDAPTHAQSSFFIPPGPTERIAVQDVRFGSDSSFTGFGKARPTEPRAPPDRRLTLVGHVLGVYVVGKPAPPN
jgi:hypothetical protein